MITVHDAEAAWNVIRTVQQERDTALSELRYYEDQQQDLLHDLELAEHGYHECAKLAKELKEVRRKRREVKNRIETLTPLAEYVEANQNTLNRLGEAIGRMRKAESNAGKRVYMRRGERRGEIIGGEK